MFLKNKVNKPDNRIGPPGCTTLKKEDRQHILKVIAGDTWVVSADLYAADGGPATPKNSYVDFVLSENQFSSPIWTGEWFSGVLPDENREGLVHIQIPREVSKKLRRGSYSFSLRVSDLMRYSYETEMEGQFLVEYAPTSDQHSIPYRDGTSDIFNGDGGKNPSTPISSDELETVKKVAQDAQKTAELANKTASSAETKADEAKQDAAQAEQNANEAVTKAQKASADASSAVATSGRAEGKADNAIQTADSAAQSASAAENVANQADSKAEEALSTAQQANEQAQQNAQAITGIEAKIPAQASAQNQLADKNFVNSSIATNTATFRGTYNLVIDLGLTVSATEEQVASAIATKLATLSITPENNDYCFVQVPRATEDPADFDPTVIARVDRYKCTVTQSGGTTTRTWGYEWSLNNSSFTAEQWAAINSGITSELVTKLGALPTADELAAALLSKYEKPPTGIPKTDLSSDVQASLNKADTALQTAPVTSVNNKTGAVTLTASDVGAATAEQGDKADTAYQKPSGGIPKTDLASDVQTSLGKADTAIQTVKVNGTALTPDTNKAVDVTMPVKATTAPVIAGTAAIGDSAKFAAENHVHPAETKAETAPTIPSSLFPITFSYDGTNYTITADYYANGYILVRNGGDTFYLQDVAQEIEFAAFDGETLIYSGEPTTDEVTNLQFNGVAPVEDVSPALIAPGVFVRGVQVAKEEDVAEKFAGLGTAAKKDAPASGNASNSQVVLGSDTRLTDARTPTAHAATHATGGGDAITPASIGAATSSQGAKADTAIQTVKVNGAALTPDVNKAVDVPVPVKATTAPVIAGTAAIGDSAKFAAENHVHPAETKVLEYALPASCFPITFHHYTLDRDFIINGNDELSFNVVGNDIWMYGDADVGEIAGFNGTTLKFSQYGSFDIENLKFNAIDPVANTSPEIKQEETVYVREVRVAKPSDIPVSSVNGKTGAVTLTASDVGALGNTGDQTLNGNLGLPNGKVIRFNSGDTDELSVDTEYLNGYPRLTTSTAGLTSQVLAFLADIYAAVQQIAPAWVSGTTYAADAKVSYNGVVYARKTSGSITSSTNPASDTTNWQSKKVSELFLPLTGGTMTGQLVASATSDGVKIMGNHAFIVISDDPTEDDVVITRGKQYFSDGKIRFPIGISGTLALLQNLAPDYDATATYALNKLCVHGGTLYRCTTAITTAEEWTVAHWTEATIEDVLAAISSALNGKAPLASPAFTGTPTAPNLTDQSADGQVANKKYVDDKVAGATPNLDYVMRVDPETGGVYYTTPDTQS